MADPKPILSRLRAILDALIPQSAPSLAENPPPAPSLPEKLPAQEPLQLSFAFDAPSPAEHSASPEDASAQKLSPVDFSDVENLLERSAPEIIEVVTENIATETRTYDRSFLLSQREAILAQKQEQMDARDLELEQIEGLLKQFETLKGTPIEIIKEKI